VNRSLARAAPMRFLIAVTICWTVGRGIALAGWQPEREEPPATAITASNPAFGGHTLSPAVATAPEIAAIAPVSLAVPPLLRRASPLRLVAPTGEIWRTAGEPLRSRFAARYAATQWLMLAAFGPGQARSYRRSDGIADSKTATGTANTRSRLSGSAWAFLRGGGRASALSPGGQIGGGQAGARLLYTIDRKDRLALSARVSRTIGGIRQTEAAVGIDWQPLAALPVHLMIERRIAIDHGGRNAWTLGAAGGAYDVRIASGWRLDGYGEAGAVGAHRRDLYADGAVRIARAIDLGGGRSLALGGGVWGAAQPGAARLDIGPSAVLRLPVAGHVVAAALDWRERMIGDSKPGSGVALTLATDF